MDGGNIVRDLSDLCRDMGNAEESSGPVESMGKYIDRVWIFLLMGRIVILSVY